MNQAIRVLACVATRLTTALLITGGLLAGGAETQQVPLSSIEVSLTPESNAPSPGDGMLQRDAPRVVSDKVRGDSPRSAPPSKAVTKQNSELFTTTDNQDNAGTGSPDGDMDIYLYEDDIQAPIEFDIAWTGSLEPTSAKLLISAFDVDETEGEVDGVFLNGTRLGTLTGVNDQWSTTVLNFSPALLAQGENRVSISIDEATDGEWAVEVDWGQIVVNDCTGNAFIRTAVLDSEVYVNGDTVAATLEIDTTSARQQVLVETNLIDANGVNVAGTSTLRSLIGQADDPFTVELELPQGSVDGTYAYQILVFDNSSARLQACETIPFENATTNSSLSVTILPPTAVDAGARWLLDGGPSQASGTTLNNLPIGEHVVSFRTIAGFDTPEPQTVFIERGATTYIEGIYILQYGGVKVSIEPPGAIAAGAQWRVDDSPFQSSGETLNLIPYGNHVVSFKEITGFAKPGNQNIFVAHNEITTLTGTYTTQVGGLTVYITPEEAINAGAQWQVDDSSFRNSGTVVNGLSVGTHTVFLKTIDGFDTPEKRTVSISNNGLATLTVEYTRQFGGLSVIIRPPGALAAGAQWNVDGGPFRNSGTAANGLTVGTHTISFKSIPGYAKPGNRSIRVNPNVVKEAAGVYTTQTGGLRVTLSPPSAVTAGAQWSVDGGPLNTSGATIDDLSVGAHLVTFKPVSGFPTPADKLVIVTGDAVINATGDYILQAGGVSVTLSPAEAVSVGAQWKVDDGPFQNSGTTADRIGVGQHTISFRTIPGFRTPDSKTITVTQGQVTNDTGVYTSLNGSLTVTLAPPAAVSAGAQWRVDGGTYRDSGTTQSGLSDGVHTISFKPIAGYAAPVDMLVTINAGQVATSSATYSQQFGSVNVTIAPASAVAAGARWRLDNGAEQESGTTLDDIPAGSHTVSFTPIAGFGAPSAQEVNVAQGQTATVIGTYTESAACCAGSPQVKTFQDAIKHYLGDFSLLVTAMMALVILARFARGVK